MTTGHQGAINVTPLIDVLLVLLIIFMVITPIDPVGLPAQIPQPAPEALPDQSRTSIVVMVRRGGRIEINTRAFALEDLQRQLTSIFGGSPLATIFITAEDDLDFGEVARVIDLARGAGISRIGLMPRKT
jgi:biopolymer transport protein ExbD